MPATEASWTPSNLNSPENKQMFGCFNFDHYNFFYNACSRSLPKDIRSDCNILVT